MIPYVCPACGTSFEFRKRVTLTKRRCPHCNEEVAVEEIDKQAANRLAKEAASLRIKLVGGFAVATGAFVWLSSGSVFLGVLVAIVVGLGTALLVGWLVMEAEKRW